MHGERNSIDPAQILRTSKIILLVDWPTTLVPRVLLGKGFIVFGYSPHHYSMGEILHDLPKDVDSYSIFPPGNVNEKNYLGFRRMEKQPQSVDIVCVFRPPAELPGIISDHALPLGAKVIWLLRPAASSQEQIIVEKNNLLFVGNENIVAIAQTLQEKKQK
jgi:predicted CoA-binding protein